MLEKGQHFISIPIGDFVELSRFRMCDVCGKRTRFDLSKALATESLHRSLPLVELAKMFPAEDYSQISKTHVMIVEGLKDIDAYRIDNFLRNQQDQLDQAKRKISQPFGFLVFWSAMTVAFVGVLSFNIPQIGNWGIAFIAAISVFGLAALWGIYEIWYRKIFFATARPQLIRFVTATGIRFEKLLDRLLEEKWRSTHLSHLLRSRKVQQSVESSLVSKEMSGPSLPPDFMSVDEFLGGVLAKF